MSEISAYRVLKSYDLITSPAYVVLSAANEFKDKTTRPNQRLFLPQGHRLGLVPTVDNPRRLQPLHHRMEALHNDEVTRRDRHVNSPAFFRRLCCEVVPISRTDLRRC